MTQTVVLVPGVGLGGTELAVLAWRLRRSGYQVRIFWTNPWSGNLAAKARALHGMLSEHRIESPYFVAHSFGGLIVLQLLADYPQWAVTRVVTLGSPLRGCGAALRVMRIPGGRWVVGEALASEASAQSLPIPAGCDAGSIAGRFNFLLGLWLCPHKPNDTIVCVDETCHPQLAAHRVLFVSHTSMLVSAQVSAQVLYFLRVGEFLPE